MSTVSAARLDRLSEIALWLSVLAALLLFPSRVRDFVLPVLPRAALAASPADQTRFAVAPVPYDAFIQSHRILPPDARVLLVTDGADVRTREYQSYHRALYYLTPRPVWWMSPAPSDGTWESGWWHSAPLTETSIRAFAAAQNTDFILLLAAPNLFPSAPLLASWNSGKLIQLSSKSQPATLQGALHSSTTPEFAGGDWLPRTAAALLAIFFCGVFVMEILLPFQSTRDPKGFRDPSSLFQTDKVDAVAWFGISWTLGAGIVALFMLAINLLPSFPLLPVTLIALAASAGLLLFALRLTRFPRPTLSITFPSLPTLFLIVALALETAFVAIIALGQPLVYWDSWVTWSMKARSIFLQGSISDPVLADPSRAVTHLDYPLLLPLNQAWLYRMIGAPDDRFVGWLAFSFFLALLALVYGAVRQQSLPPRRALLAATVVGSMPSLTLLAGANFAEIPLAAYVVLTASFLLLWIQRGSPAALILVVIGASCLAFTKREGLLLAITLSLAALITFPSSRRAWLGALACSFSALLIASAWNLYLSRFNTINTDFLPLSFTTFAGNLDRVPIIFSYFVRNLLDLQWSFLWMFVVVFLIYRAWAFASTQNDSSSSLTRLHPDSAPCFLKRLFLRANVALRSQRITPSRQLGLSSRRACRPSRRSLACPPNRQHGAHHSRVSRVRAAKRSA
jgi:hypothetical protein